MFSSYFDLVLCDAPCSGEGMFRKYDEAITEWSEENVLACAKRQKDILENCAKTVKDGGYLLYVEKDTPHDEIKKCFDYTAHTLEYANIFYEVACATYLLNNEFAVTLVMHADNLPKEIEKELELC